MKKDKYRIVTVVGARPQFMKAAATSHAFSKSERIEELLVHSGQHYDQSMSEVFFKNFGMKEPDYNLEVRGGTHGDSTGRMLIAIEPLYQQLKPDALLIFGDTNTSAAAALAAVKLHIPVIHVEAGPRVYDLKNPEDVNRRIIDHMSSLRFTPSLGGMEFLEKENLSENSYFVGDVMYDTLLRFKSNFEGQASAFSPDKPFMLMTIHREENTDNIDNLIAILDGISKCAIEVIFPAHPRTSKVIIRENITLPSNIQIIEPLGYFDLMREVVNCKIVATDSGGLQKEAYFLNKPAIVLQDASGWPELIEVGANILTGANSNSIAEAYKKLIDAPRDFGNFNPYGSGNAADLIRDKTIEFLDSN